MIYKIQDTALFIRNMMSLNVALCKNSSKCNLPWNHTYCEDLIERYFNVIENLNHDYYKISQTHSICYLFHTYTCILCKQTKQIT